MRSHTLLRQPEWHQDGEMTDQQALQRALTSIDGSGYGSYKRLKGSYAMGGFTLVVDKVQVDPYAPPSLMRVRVPADVVKLPQTLIDDDAGVTAAEDYLTRQVAEALGMNWPGSSTPSRGGSRQSRESQSRQSQRSSISIGKPLQQVLQRTSVRIDADGGVEARIAVELPAAGRRVKGRVASRILTEELPAVVASSLTADALDREGLQAHVTLFRDQQYLRSVLAERHLVSFVGDGAILPRESGDTDVPLTRGAVPFQSPDGLRVEFALPSGRTVTGMGVPEGVTVIVGGGYHGKSTLLRGMERGVYSHIAGDGREWVITREDASSIRAEDGRAVTGVDISAFIGDLPSGADTTRFSTANASGSTSQAAALSEAVEAGSSVLLIDEDTSATNFMIRDERMRQLIAADREPITPFVDRVRPLLAERGVSTVLVAGGSGAFFDVADHVIAVDAYVPRDVTAQAQRIAGREGPQDQGSTDVFSANGDRVPVPGCLREEKGAKPAKARGSSVVQLGRQTVDLSALSQLVDPGQTTGIAHALDWLAQRFDGRLTVTDAVAQADRLIDADGIDALSPHRGHPGQFARPRTIEIQAALNRVRSLEAAAHGK